MEPREGEKVMIPTCKLSYLIVVEYLIILAIACMTFIDNHKVFLFLIVFA